MNFYAKSTLYDTKLRHQEERVGLLKTDFARYIACVSQ